MAAAYSHHQTLPLCKQLLATSNFSFVIQLWVLFTLFCCLANLHYVARLYIPLPLAKYHGSPNLQYTAWLYIPLPSPVSLLYSPSWLLRLLVHRQYTPLKALLPSTPPSIDCSQSLVTTAKSSLTLLFARCTCSMASAFGRWAIFPIGAFHVTISSLHLAYYRSLVAL